MNITLSDGTTSKTLDPQMIWNDRNSWSPVAMSVTKSLTGALIIQSAAQLTGRPITLKSDEGRGWMDGGVVRQLQTWANVAGQTLTLTIDGEARTVMFRHNEAPALTASPLFDWSDLDDTKDYYMTIKFMEID
jgi:hypothetical protein